MIDDWWFALDTKQCLPIIQIKIQWKSKWQLNTTVARMDDDTETKKQCFTSIQKKKLLGAVDSFQLCPSMDLVVFGTSSTSASLQNLFRTVSWQKVASINLDESETASISESSSTVCWSPNGRWITVAKDSQISLYGVEPLANPSTGSSFSGSSGPSEKNHSWRTRSPVIGLYWAHVGRPHPTAWKLTLEEEEEQTFWRYVSCPSYHVFPSQSYPLSTLTLLMFPFSQLSTILLG